MPPMRAILVMLAHKRSPQSSFPLLSQTHTHTHTHTLLFFPHKFPFSTSLLYQILLSFHTLTSCLFDCEERSRGMWTLDHLWLISCLESGLGSCSLYNKHVGECIWMMRLSLAMINVRLSRYRFCPCWPQRALTGSRTCLQGSVECLADQLKRSLVTSKHSKTDGLEMSCML